MTPTFSRLGKVGTTFWQAGLLAMTIPEKYGGLEVDSLTYVMALEEIAQGCNQQCHDPAYAQHRAAVHLSPLQRRSSRPAFIPEVVEHGKLFGSWAAERGTSFTRHPFVSVGIYRDGEGYRISGQKTFCTMAGAASYYMVWCTAEGFRGYFP